MQPNYQPPNDNPQGRNDTPSGSYRSDGLPPVTAGPPQEPLTSRTGLASPKKPLYARGWFIALITTLVVAIVAAGVAIGWYRQALLPVVESDSAELIQVVIEPGTMPDQIASQLEDSEVIRSATAFSIHTRLEGTRHKLQAGSYRLSPADSTPEVASKLLGGQVDQLTVTFYPGSSLYISGRETDQTPSHREALEALGYPRSEIEAAFMADYDHPLLVDKPAGESIEGYIYGETYNMPAGSSLEDILNRTFDEMYAQLQAGETLEAYRQRGLSLHEAITLASIIEREVHTEGDQRQVAQVFYKRLDEAMPLGADATFVYAARMDGAAPTVNYDSPYNTRLHSGLPPGPIASPSATAMQAVASPAEGDYLYFVSGDDGKNYFSRTLEDHEHNTKRYCQANCSLF